MDLANLPNSLILSYGWLLLFSVDSLEFLVDGKLSATCDAAFQISCFLCETVLVWVDICGGSVVSRDASDVSVLSDIGGCLLGGVSG